ncbi:hypothetical protein Aperf_G00000046536 [Anoplocephala perfoliata]
MSNVPMEMRADLFNRLIQLQQYFGFCTEVEHLATVLVDRFTWRKLIHPDRYDLLGMTAVIIASKLTCRRRKVSFKNMCSLSMNKYQCGDMAAMEREMIVVLKYNLISPIPHTFLGFAIAASLEMLKELEENEYFLLGRYIFELGLTELTLSQCSASLKCAASVYLIRHLLRLRGQRSPSKQYLLQTLPIWTESLTAATGHREGRALRETAFTYGLLLIEAQFFLNEISPPGLMTGCAPRFRAAFEKYIHENSACIAAHPLLRKFTTTDIECFIK